MDFLGYRGYIRHRLYKVVGFWVSFWGSFLKTVEKSSSPRKLQHLPRRSTVPE